MSVFHGPQHKGAMRVHKDLKRRQAVSRNGRYQAAIAERGVCINCEMKNNGLNRGYHCGKCWCCR